MNTFNHYSHLQAQYMLAQRLANPQTQVPRHMVQPKQKRANAAQLQRLEHLKTIEHQNQSILQKLLKISCRKEDPSAEHSSVRTYSLPRLHRLMQVPTHSEQNGVIAEKLLAARPYYSMKQQLSQHDLQRQRKERLQKYVRRGDGVVSRQQNIAELLFQRKLKRASLVESRYKTK